VPKRRPVFSDTTTYLPTRLTIMYYPVLIGMAVLRAAVVFGSVTVRRPFLNDALTLLSSTGAGSRTLRENDP
jgi:hypothetical protein